MSKLKCNQLFKLFNQQNWALNIFKESVCWTICVQINDEMDVNFSRLSYHLWITPLEINHWPDIFSSNKNHSQLDIKTNSYCLAKMTISRGISTPIFILIAFLALTQAYPEQGKFSLNLNGSHSLDGVAKNLYNSTKLFIKVSCNGAENIKIGWVLRETHVSTNPWKLIRLTISLILIQDVSLSYFHELGWNVFPTHEL